MAADGMDIKVSYHETDGRPLSVSLPDQVACVVAETQANVQGAQTAPTYKPATLANGIVRLEHSTLNPKTSPPPSPPPFPPPRPLARELLPAVPASCSRLCRWGLPAARAHHQPQRTGTPTKS